MTCVSRSLDASSVSVNELSKEVKQLHISKPAERPSNSRIFQRFLELLSMQCSNGSRFHCLENAGTACPPCEVLRRHIATYVDVATLEEICNTRKQGGICSYLYCNNTLAVRTKTGNRSESLFKIDLAAQKIYRRKLYESFCSTRCIERHAEAELVAQRSPMEREVINPRALKNTGSKAVHTLLNSLQQLDTCTGLSRAASLDKVEWYYATSRDRLSGMVNDKCVMFNYKPLSKNKSVRFTLPEGDTDSYDSHDTTENYSQETADVRPVFGTTDFFVTTDENTDSPREMANSNAAYSGICDLAEKTEKRDSIFNCLNIFSILWYTLSTCVTYKTREFFKTGATDTVTLDGKSKAWYEAMLPQIPEELAPFVTHPLCSLLCTFRMGKNTPDMDDDYTRVLMYLLLYVLIYNRERIFAGGDVAHFTQQEWEGHLQRLESILLNGCKLDLDSIAVVNELLTECE